MIGIIGALIIALGSATLVIGRRPGVTFHVLMREGRSIYGALDRYFVHSAVIAFRIATIVGSILLIIEATTSLYT